MWWKFAKVLLILMASLLLYQYGSHLHMLHKADNRLQTISAKSAECERKPDSRCFAELAVMHLPPFSRFSAFDSTGRNLRFLGFGDIVDARLESDLVEHADQYRDAYRLHQLLNSDPQAFAATEALTDTFAYNILYFRNDPDYTGYGGGGTAEVLDAEKAALARRGRVGTSPQRDLLFAQWLEALELYGDSGLDWLFYTSRAREAGYEETASYALGQARQRGLSPTSDWTIVEESWRLHGVDAGLAAAAGLPTTNRRARAYLLLAGRLFDQGDVGPAKDVYARFVDSHDETAPFRSPLGPRNRARTAALLTHKLFGTGQAIPWVVEYRKHYSFVKQFVSARDTAELYADIGAHDRAVAAALESIEHAPEPGETARGPWLSTVDTTPYHNGTVGRAIGVLCQAGRFEDAFARLDGNPQYGPPAIDGCRTALDDDLPLMTIDELANKLGLKSRRKMQEYVVAGLVRAGSYEAASDMIRHALDEPSAHPEVSRAFANLVYLRLAIAMRDKSLTTMILKSIASDDFVGKGDRAVQLFSTVAIMIQHWPGLSVGPTLPAR